MEDVSNKILDLYNDLFAKFEGFYYQDELPVCHFIVDPQTKRLVQAIHKYENSERKQTKSLFLRISTPFLDVDTYTTEALGEFKYIVEQARTDYFVPNELGLNLELPEHIDSITELLVIMKSFAEQFAQFPDELVLYMDPMYVYSEENWVNWLGGMIEEGIPDDVKVMFCSVQGQYSLSTLEDRYSELIYSIAPNYDFTGLMEEMAASGDPSEPANQFRNAFTRMTTAAQKGKWDKALQYGDEALLITQQQTDWEHLEISVHLAIASFHLSRNQDEQALERYDLATNMADQLHQTNPAVGITMIYQALQSRAGAFLKMGKTNEALEDYQTCSAALTDEKGMELQRMECQRMAGWCLQRLNQDGEAFEYYNMAMESAKAADPQGLPYTTLPYIGKELISFAQLRGDGDLQQEVESFLVEHIGEDWELFITT